MPNAQDVTLLITHYNRPASLERLLEALRALDCQFAEVIVSDDGSNAESQARLDQLRETHGFTLLRTERNRGLGNNINKGQDAVKTPLVLYVQEDFSPTELFPKRLASAVAMMNERPDLDVVRLFYLVKYPRLEPYRDSFSTMRFDWSSPTSKKFFVYSDTPHLRRKTFFQRFGRYAEGIPAIKTEKAMVMSFLQAGGKAVIVNESDAFHHENSSSEPSTQDYSKFFRIKEKFPDSVFEALWVSKLTLELLFRRYRQ
jgi:glycosyltransferase involved in cell wall biosynthesis